LVKYFAERRLAESRIAERIIAERIIAERIIAESRTVLLKEELLKVELLKEDLLKEVHVVEMVQPLNLDCFLIYPEFNLSSWRNTYLSKITTTCSQLRSLLVV
jgi:hypothetical protein